jgi:hypothetical protein
LGVAVGIQGSVQTPAGRPEPISTTEGGWPRFRVRRRPRADVELRQRFRQSRTQARR